MRGTGGAAMTAPTTRFDNNTGTGILVVPDFTELDVDVAISRMRDDEDYDLYLDVPPCPDPEPPTPLADRYRSRLADPDPAVREVAREQLRRLKGAPPPAGEGAAPDGGYTP